MKRKYSILFMAVLIGCFFSFCTACNKKADVKYVNSRANFCAKVNTSSVIYVDDIDFGSETESEQIKIEKSVSIVGKKSKSVLENVYFYIAGGGLESEMITVDFQNIVFDGKYDNESLEIDSTISYTKNMGTKRDERRAIHAEGFISLSIDNCDFTNYNSFGGAAIYANYTDGNVDLYKRMYFSMRNCNVYNNFTFRGAVHFNGVRPMTALFENCNFYNNKASYASCIYAGGVIATIENCSFKNNVYQEVNNVYATDYVTREKLNYTSGQAIHFNDADGVLSNSVFENNRGYTGGAISSYKSLLNVDSCKFLRNTAENNGGAIAVFSKETMPTFITNSTFIGNKANNQGNVFSNVNAEYVYRKVKAAKVEFSLCTFAENNGNNNTLFYNDTSTYKYIEGLEWRDESVTPFVYNIEKEPGGKYLYNNDNVEDEVLGSIVIDKSFVAKDNSYTKAYSLEQAINLGIIDKRDYSRSNDIKINKDSAADIIIPKDILSTYANGKYMGMVANARIGANDFSPKNEINWLWWAIGSIGIASCLAFGSIILIRRRKGLTLATEAEKIGNEKTSEFAKTKDFEEINKEKIEKIIVDFKLSQREKEVLNGLLDGKTAKQISIGLYISFDTVRFHIKKIYRKLGVHSQSELKIFCHNYTE